MANLGHYDAHSGYPNQSIVIYKKLKTTQAGNVQTAEVEVSRGSEWFAGGELEPDDRGVNVAGIAFEMLVNDVTWMGAPESFLHQASFENIRDKTADFPLSPLITDQAEGQAMLARLFEYHDLFGRPHKDTWQFELCQWEHGNIDVDALPEIDSDDLTEEPQLTGELWEDTINYVRARYADRAHGFKEKLSAPASDPNNFRIVGEKRNVELDRTWCTDGDLANHAASVYLGIHAQPLIKDSIRVKRESVDAKGLYPGTLARLNVATDGRTYVIRLGDMDWPAEAGGDVGFQIENERGIWPQRYVPPALPQPGNFISEPVEIANKRVLELPSGLKTDSAPQVVVLAQRPSDKIVGFAVHAGVDPDVLDLVATHNNFSAFGKVVTAAYPAGTDDLDLTTGIQVEIFGVDKVGTQTDSQRDDNTVLLIVDNEIMSVGQETPIGGGKNRYYVKRGLYGTAKANHFIGANCWFIPRSSIVPISNRNFAPGVTGYFRLQPYTQTQELDLADVDSFAYVFAGGAVGAPYQLELSTRAEATSEGKLESLIFAEWQRYGDQDIFLFEYQWRISGTADWQKSTTTETAAHWPVQPNTLYEVRVRGINAHGEPGAWSEIATITSASVQLFSVSHLELEGRGNDTDNEQRDFNFTVRVTSPARAAEIGSAPVGPAVRDPAFGYLQWDVYAGKVTRGEIEANTVRPIYTEPTADKMRLSFTYEKNLEAARRQGAANPYAQITVDCYAYDAFGNETNHEILTVQNPAPPAPVNFLVTSAFTSAFGEWQNGSVRDIEKTQVFENTVDDFATATLVTEVAYPGNTFTRIGRQGGVPLFYWLRAVDTFGTPSAPTAAATVTPGAVPAADIENFSITASKLFLDVVILEGDVWSNNTPAAGSVSVNAHKLFYRGVEYAIAAGSTAFKYIWWVAGDAGYTAGDVRPPPTNGVFLIAMNVAGVLIKNWNSFSNVVVGSAHIEDAAIIRAKIALLAVDTARIADLAVSTAKIADLAVTNAKINDLSADKINAGFIAAARIAAGTIVNGHLGDGAVSDAKIADAAIIASKIAAGAVNADKIEANAVTTSKLAAGAITADKIAADAVIARTVQSDDYVAGVSGNHMGKDGYAEFGNVLIRDGAIIRTMAAPTFTNDYDASALTSRTWNDNDLISVRAHGPAGKKIRFTTDGSEVTSLSPYWPWYSPDHGGSTAGDGVGPDDFLGFPLGGSGYNGTIRARAVSGPNGEFLGEEAQLHLTHVPIDLLPLPAATPPSISKSSGTRGVAGYKVKIVSSLAGATIMVSVDGGANYSVYDPAGNYRTDNTVSLPTSNAGEIAMSVDSVVMAYVKKDGYSPSGTDTVWNTAIDPAWTDPGWRGPPGTDPP